MKMVSHTVKGQSHYLEMTIVQSNVRFDRGINDSIPKSCTSTASQSSGQQPNASYCYLFLAQFIQKCSLRFLVSFNGWRETCGCLLKARNTLPYLISPEQLQPCLWKTMPCWPQPMTYGPATKRNELMVKQTTVSSSFSHHLFYFVWCTYWANGLSLPSLLLLHRRTQRVHSMKESNFHMLYKIANWIACWCFADWVSRCSSPASIYYPMTVLL